jgi:hypothetical protein
MTALRTAGRVATTVLPLSQMARLGWPGLFVVVALVVALAALAVGVVCWVIGSDARAARAARLLLAFRGRRD